MRSNRLLRVCLGLCCLASSTTWAAEKELRVGAAKIDITPEHPVRLSGYGGRRTESEGVAQHLWAKALAIETKNGTPALLITVDNVGVPGWVRDELAKRLKKQQVNDDRLAICSTHTHSAPCLSGVLSNLFSQDIATNEWANIDRYTRKLLDQLEEVALAALKDLQPGKLHWGQGRVPFAKNRRTEGGPVDHAMPLLKVTDRNGKLRAVLANYACHCTTLGGEFNQTHGDWAGCAQEAIERDHPGVVALISIGCGADANPSPRGNVDNAKRNGEELAAEVKDMLAQDLTPLTADLNCRLQRIELPFDTLPTRAQWEARAKEKGIVGYHAQKNLVRLDHGEKLPTRLPYTVQAWNFGNELGIIFLAGEVVVDYSLRLKRELDSSRVWVNAYANDVPCYIPSRRILKEGGYEAESSLWYYDRPAHLAPETEDLIIKTAHDLVPDTFKVKPEKAELPDPVPPAKAVRTFRTKPGLAIELAAAEPLVQSPVVIDWDAEGRLWVVEMFDYPMGVDGDWKPGGRVKMLEDKDGDGHYDRATVFLDGLPFPTGLMVTPRGVLVAAAPNIIFAQDTNGDGKADVVRTNYSGFATHNFQARVNGFAWGLDGWIHGSSGLFGGKIKNLVTGKNVDLSGRDFRIDPATWEIEPVAGISQQGRIRDDGGNWFGNDNSTLLWHYPLPDHYARRNPHVTYPAPAVNVAARTKGDANKLFPISHTLERFNDPQAANRTTSACGPEIYRDRFLGDAFYGNAFICEPVHNLVTRRVLEPDGVTFKARRADDEQQREFLASTDNWSRPVQVRTGPDGALWVVDMYRFVIEHPRWIPPERLKKLDVRAGAEMGRIYRIYPQGKRPKIPALATVNLVKAFDTDNGPTRDKVQSRSRIPNVALAELFNKTSRPAVRLQCLSMFEDMPPEILTRALTDSNSGVRCEALRVAKRYQPEMAAFATDPDPNVRFQLALSLGQWKDPEASQTLTRLPASDSWMQAAILSSAKLHFGPLLRESLKTGPNSFFVRLLESAIAFGGKAEVTDALAGSGSLSPSLVSSLMDALERQKLDWHTWLANPKIEAAIREQLNAARTALKQGREERAAVNLLGREETALEDDIKLLCRVAKGPLSSAALERLGKIDDRQVPVVLLAEWKAASPVLRGRIVNLLVSRNSWIEDLLAAVKEDVVSPSEIALEQRQRLLKHENAGIRERAEKLLPVTAKRTEVLARYKEIDKLSANTAHGAEVFEKNCATCHLHRGKGNAVGPALAEFSGKSADDFAVAIFDPNAAVDAKFVTYSVDTTDGRSFTGVVKDETASSFVVVQGGGLRQNVLRSEVSEMQASKLSLMPEGFEQGLSPQDTADLIAWIKQSSPARFGQAGAEQINKSRADFLARSPTSFRVLSGSEQLPYPGWLGRLPMPHCRQSDGKSKLSWQCAAPRKSADTLTFTFPVAMGFMSQPAGKFSLKVNGKAALDFNVSLADEAWSENDVRMSYTVMESNSEDSNGILEISAPAALVEAGKPMTFEVTGSAAGGQRWFGIYVLPQQNAANRANSN